jgi:hypothetical protein
MGKRLKVADWFVGKVVPIHVRGRVKYAGVIAVGEDGVKEFRRKTQAKHILRLPPAICIDIDLLNYLEEQKGVRRVVNYHKRHYYSASTSRIRQGFPVNRRYNKQVGLPMGAWTIDGREQGEVQPPLLPVADKAPAAIVPVPKPEAMWPERKDLE